jgi:dienelactone hydrolase
MMKQFFVSLILVVSIHALAHERVVYESEVFTDQEPLQDQRFKSVRKYRGMDYTLPEYKSLETWEKRAKDLRTRILVTTGLYPELPRFPLNARVFDPLERAEYTVYKVYFESWPGFYVTGNLYVPKGKGPFPAILSPHGHWESRLYDSETNSIPGRAINFAQRGYVVFSYDMVGYADSKQVSHRFADSRLDQLWGINLMGLQLWNSIRSVDFLYTLDTVDTSRIGCTGASGGGTQTFMLTAVDKRIKVSAPVNMISAHFQGGCLCENAPGLRTETFNVEIGALAAPCPLLMVSTTQDWTVNTPTIEFPMMKSIYDLYDHPERVDWKQFDYPHNYNKDSRQAVYTWFEQWFKGRKDTAVVKEIPFTLPAKDSLLVFSDDFPPPGEMNETRLKMIMRQTFQKQLQENWPDSRAELQAFIKLYQPAMDHVLQVTADPKVVFKRIKETTFAGGTCTAGVVRRDEANDWIPVIRYGPETTLGTVILVHSLGKRETITGYGSWIEDLTHNGYEVICFDPFRVGEHTVPQKEDSTLLQLRHFETFNKSDAQFRIQDILTLDGMLTGKSLWVGLDRQASLWLIFASTQQHDMQMLCRDLVLPGSVSDLMQIFMPGLARIGGMQTAMAWAAPRITVYESDDSLWQSFDVNSMAIWQGADRESLFSNAVLDADEIIKRYRSFSKID